MSTKVDEAIENLAKNDFIVFAGAGVVGGTGVSPSWLRVLEKFKDNEPSVVIENLKEMKESEYDDLAQKIFDRLEQQNKTDIYYSILREALRATSTNWSAEEFDIVDTAKHVITTNYDDGFEHALKRVLEKRQINSVIQSLPELKCDALSKEYSISYLHGRVNEECVVFKSDDYQTFYPSLFEESGGCDNLERFLRYIYEERSIVFIGFSFADRCFLEEIQKIYSDIKRNDIIGKNLKRLYKASLEDIQHYACLRKFDKERETRELLGSEKLEREKVGTIIAEREKRDQELEKTLDSIKIKVLRYEEHKDWTEWFERIRNLRRLLRGVRSVKNFERP